VIAGGLWPFHPPALPLIEVSGCRLLIPGADDFRFWLIDASRHGLRISAAGGCSFGAPTDRNGSRNEERR